MYFNISNLSQFVHVGQALAWADMYHYAERGRRIGSRLGRLYSTDPREGTHGTVRLRMATGKYMRDSEQAEGVEGR